MSDQMIKILTIKVQISQNYNMHLNMLALKFFMDRIYNHTYKVNTEIATFPFKVSL